MSDHHPKPPSQLAAFRVRRLGTSDRPPRIPDDAPANFALAVGKALQNFGTVEYLVNQILEKIIRDPLILGHITKLPISKRLDILAGLVARDQAKIEAEGLALSNIISTAKSAFQHRNQIAHNPMVVKESRSDDVTCLTIGIHVIRYAETGSSEEWIDHQKLTTFITNYHSLIATFNHLLAIYSA